MELFYTKNIEGGIAQLSEEESYHCIKILRHTTSDRIFFTNGEGDFFEGRIREAHPKKCIVEITNHTTEFNKRGYSIHIAIAPTKNIDRIEFFIEKAVEIGIDEITFIKSERSERKEVKLERLVKIAVAAMKQSKRAYLPKMNNVVSFKEFIKIAPSSSYKYIASLVETDQVAFKDIAKGGVTLILIGPEGDFSPDEVKYAINNHFRPLTLGNTVLRTETAGIVACSWISFMNQ